MSTMIDNFTSTVDGAAAFERAHAEEPEPGPTLADVTEHEPDWLEEDGVHHAPSCTRPAFHHEDGVECTP